MCDTWILPQTKRLLQYATDNGQGEICVHIIPLLPIFIINIKSKYLLYVIVDGCIRIPSNPNVHGYVPLQYAHIRHSIPIVRG